VSNLGESEKQDLVNNDYQQRIAIDIKTVVLYNLPC
jgi:hypothetical protein